MNETEKLIKEEIDSIIKEYKTRILNESMVSKIINKSPATLGRWRKKGIKLKYKKDASAKNSPIEYTVRTVAEYIIDGNIEIN